MKPNSRFFTYPLLYIRLSFAKICMIYARGGIATGELIVFTASVAVCCVTVYILGMFWFGDYRNRKMASLFVLGLGIVVWTLANAVMLVTHEAHYFAFNTVRTIMISVVPYLTVWFVLQYIDSTLLKRRWFRALLVTLPAIDLILILTNPLHHMYTEGYIHPGYTVGTIYWLRAFTNYSASILSFSILMWYILKNERKKPFLLLTVIVMSVPYILSVIHTFELLPLPGDLSPLTFCVTLLLFIDVSYRFKVLNIKKPTLFITTINSISEIIVLFNKKRELFDVNASAVEFFADSPFYENKHAKLADLVACLRGKITDAKPGDILSLLEAGVNFEGEFAVMTDSGEVQTYTVMFRKNYDHGKITGYLFMMIDISAYHRMINEISDKNIALTELKEKAESASKAKGDFLSIMSHEMRTPLNAIIGMTAIAKKVQDTEGKNKALVKVEDASSHLLGVINDVLDMAKIEASKFDLSAVEFNFEAMMRKVLTVIQYRADEKKQILTVRIDEKIPKYIIGDNQRMAQVITNLLSNAIKFTGEKGRILFDVTLLCEENDRCELRVEITDTGIGISPEQQGKLFGTFEQVKGGAGRDYGGTGLGLAISKRIVEMMGGSIWVESELGKGAKFIFTAFVTVNRQPRENVREYREAGDGETAADGIFKDKKLLLAEDIEINREIVIELLKETGVEIDCAGNGEQACGMVYANPEKYHAVLMDVQMPIMSGIEATKRLRATPPKRPGLLPIIAMTANVFKDDIENCLSAGMDDHLGKPLDVDKVMEVLLKWL
jgi:signal transduction histidine kinase/ActR/RegA family two-component response regulator